MHRTGNHDRARRTRALVATSALALALSACGSSDGDVATTDPTTTEATTTSGAVDGDGSTTDATTTSSASGSTSAPTTATTALPDAGLAQRSAPPDGTGTALLTAVRVGRNDGYERIVFEFEGSPVPGYRVGWVDGPITADGSGEPVDVAGDAYLEIVLQPASGVDLSAPELRITYDGPDRIDTSATTDTITDLVRTGDFEAVLTWVAGATEEAPFRVLALQSPTRIVVDVAT